MEKSESTLSRHHSMARVGETAAIRRFNIGPRFHSLHSSHSSRISFNSQLVHDATPRTSSLPPYQFNLLPMPAKQITLTEPYVACQNQLGEGCLWDPTTGLLHWVDIKRSQIHTLDPVSGNRLIDDYSDVDGMITSLVLRKDKPGVRARTLGSCMMADLLHFCSSSARIRHILQSSPKRRNLRIPTRRRSSASRPLSPETSAFPFLKSTHRTRKMARIASTMGLVMRSVDSGELTIDTSDTVQC